MTIRREDLVAAAALGLLQYRQIDPLLLFLLQRDLLAKRKALHRERERRREGLFASLTFGAALLATVAGVLFALLLTSRGASITWSVLIPFIALYAFGACGAVALARARGYRLRVRVASAALMAAVPVAVFALQSLS